VHLLLHLCRLLILFISTLTSVHAAAGLTNTLLSLAAARGGAVEQHASADMK